MVLTQRRGGAQRRKEVVVSVRTKGRAKFYFRGRAFVWLVQDDKWLRVASADKRFVVAYSMIVERGEKPCLVVNGEEFLGLENHRRPIHLLPELPNSNSVGSLVNNLLEWCFDPNHPLIIVDRAVTED